MEIEINSEEKATGFWRRFTKLFNSDKSPKTPPALPNDRTMWVPDEKAPTCYNCQKQFSAIFLRKHHCRICGNVFCKDCSSKSVEGKYWGSKKEIKVCDYCYEMYRKLDETLVETTIGNKQNYVEDIDSIEDNMKLLKRETKLSEYCKNYKRETEDYYKFLQMDKKSEEPIKGDLEAFYEHLVKHFIEVVLKNEGVFEKWFDKIFELTKKTINSVNPSFKDLKDSMNINDYVKIKTIQYKDHSLCKVIDGYAFQKNVTSKTMNSSIDNPRILLLDCGLDYERDKDNITSFDNLMTLEPAYFSIIMKKIELVEPTVILVNKNVSRKILESLTLSNKVSVVMNVKSNSLKKIARCTKTYVLPSTDLIDQQTILGTCKKFRVEKIKSASFNSSKGDSLKANELNLMIFEGCDYVLYNTIILSGPDLNELALIKKLMKTILLAVRDLFLQKVFLYFFYCELPDAPEEFYSRMSISSSISNLSLSNNSQSLLYKHPNFVMNNLVETCPIIREFTSGFDTCIFYNRSRIFNLVQLTMTLGKGEANINSEDKSTGGNMPTFQTFGGSLAESEVLKQVNSTCRGPEDLEFIFYCDKDLHDKPLGKLIIDLCHEADTRCDDCKKPKNAHVYYVYKKLGRLKIETVQSLSDKKDNINGVLGFINRNNTDFSKYTLYKNEKQPVNYNFDIFSYGVCKFCGIATPLIKLPRELFNFSVAMFFKFMLNNHELKVRSDKRAFNLMRETLASECKHNVNRDIHRIFITKLGTIKISYEDSPFYVIETSPMNERSDLLAYSALLEFYCWSARDKSMDVLSALFNNFKILSEKFAEVQHEAVQVYCERTQKIISKYMNVTNELVNFVDNLFTYPKFEDYVKANVYIKRVYFRIVQVKLVQNWVRKILRKVKKTISHLAKMKAVGEKDNHISGSNHNINYPSNYTNTHNSPRNSVIRDLGVKEIISGLNSGNVNNTVSFTLPRESVMLKEGANINVNFAAKESISHMSQSSYTSYMGNNNTQSGNNNINANFAQNTLPITPSNALNVTLSNDIEFSHKESSLFEKIDMKESYRAILKEISHFDESHTKCSSDHNEDDLGSIIAYTLTSDKYRDFISPNNKFKLIDIKCERKPRTAFDPLTFYKENIKKEIKTFCVTESGDITGMTNLTGLSEGRNAAMAEEEVQDTSLLFDQSKNTYQYQNLDNHKIYQQLETELLSDEKVHFTLVYSNANTMNHLCTWNMPIEFVKKKTEINQSVSNSSLKVKEKPLLDIEDKKEAGSNLPSVNTASNIIGSNTVGTNSSGNTGAGAGNSNSHSNTNTISNFDTDEKLILQGDNIKLIFEEVEAIKKELKAMKESPQQENNKTKKQKKVEFVEESILSHTEYEVFVYYPRQFEALRITYCATYEEFILSAWSDCTGGKSKADFYKSHDNKFILKRVNKHEFKMFIETGFQYFHHNAKFLFHKMPSALAKILGAYKIKVRSHKHSKDENSYLILMENLFYGKEGRAIKAYDLKGSRSNRYIPKRDIKGPDQVLPDTNFKEDFKGEPIALERNMAELLKFAVHNDSLILSKMNVVDYSLLLIIDDLGGTHKEKEEGHSSGCPQCNIKTVRVGIIDYVRKYTWDKQLEHVGKIIINRLQVPTIVNPMNYKERFKEAIDNFFIGL